MDITPGHLYKDGYVKSGVDMMTFFYHIYNHWKISLGAKGDKLAASNGKTYYLDIRMDGDEMVIDNHEVFRTANNGRPGIRINKTLALQMKWFERNKEQHYRLKMGPNLIMRLYEDQIPEVLDVTDEDKPDKTIFWKEDGDFIQLSVFCSWRFIRLNEAFRTHWPINDRVMYVLSDAASSGIVRDKTEDLLCTIPYGREHGHDTFHSEQNIHYKALRKAFFQFIVTELVEAEVVGNEGN